MTWLTLRLHRIEAAIGVLLFAALMLVMFLAMRSVDSAYDAVQAGSCFDSGQDLRCGERLMKYYGLVSRWGNLTTLLHGVPLAAAALLVIPTLQELERGTHRLAWTQSISRRRWTLSRIGFVAGIATVVAVVWAVTASDWRASVLRGEERLFGRDAFELSAEVLLGYGLFAVGLGLAVAVVVRRLVPTLIVLATGFIGTRIFTTFVLRERYRAPIQETVPAAIDAGQFTGFQDRWILDQSWLTRAGERLSWEEVNRLCTPLTEAQNTDNFYSRCLVDNGLQYFRSYQPADRVHQFELIETMLYLAAAATMLAFSYWWLTRRPASSSG